MLVLALDTTTRKGSVALSRHGVVLGVHEGDAAVTHGKRLPADIVLLLDRQGLALRDIDLFAVASGPGSFTGLRVGIATMQGLALANARKLVGISALDACYAAARARLTASRPHTRAGVWMDAQRGQVFAALYGGDEPADGPLVGTPAEILEAWRDLDRGLPIVFAGEGAAAHADLIRGLFPSMELSRDVPLAPSIALLAEDQAGGAALPDSIRPLYIRRPDVELTRDRKARI